MRRHRALASTRASWICRNEEERARLVAMHRLLVPANRRIGIVALLTLLPCLPTLPPVVIGVLFASFGVVVVIGQSLTRWRRPEVVLASSVAVVEIADAVAMALAHVQRLGALTLLLWPLMSFNARYPRRVAIAGTALTALLVILTELVTGPGAVLRDPLALSVPLAVVIAVAVTASAARASDIEHMRRAVLDPLTGLLNRGALSGRVSELAQRSARTNLSVAVLIGDIDDFKAINDAHGHHVGDQVLHGVAARLREQLRAFDLLYRIGGEEFAVLAPGASLEQGAALADQLRLAVGAERMVGLQVSISWGVSASAPGSVFDWGEQYRAADAALYAAKQAGRDRVEYRASPEAIAA